MSTISNATQRRRTNTKARNAYAHSHVDDKLICGTRGASFLPGQLGWRPVGSESRKVKA